MNNGNNNSTNTNTNNGNNANSGAAFAFNVYNISGARPFIDGDIIDANANTARGEVLRGVLTCINALLSIAKIKRDKIKNGNIAAYLENEISALRYMYHFARIDGGKQCGARLSYSAELYHGRADISELISEVNAAYSVLMQYNGQKMTRDTIAAVRSKYGTARTFDSEHAANGEHAAKYTAQTFDSGEIYGGERYNGGHVDAVTDIKSAALRTALAAMINSGAISAAAVDLLLDVSSGTALAVIAERCGVNKSTISRRYAAALKSITEYLTAHGVTAAVINAERLHG